MKRILNAFIYSLSGLAAALKDEAAFRQLVILAVVGIVLAIFLPITLLAKVLIILIHLMSLAVELLNTGIEAAIDRISEERHPLSKKAKDCGSAAQLMLLIAIALIWVVAITGIV